jgi:glycosyltransferase involved in cell wall biosynthesis
MMARRPEPARSRNAGENPWVLIAGGFHCGSGMDRLNLALARYLLRRGCPLNLVCHSAEPDLYEAGAAVHIVPRPANSFLLGAYLLARRGAQVARSVTVRSPLARVVVNGGNCAWPDINWVHCVHRAWPCCDEGAPGWFKLKNRASRWLACRDERSALRQARIVIANSQRTRRELLEISGIRPDCVHVVYPGSDPVHSPPSPEGRASARAWLAQDPSRPLVVFAGGLGHDLNKGFDVLFRVWRRLCARPQWDANLAVAGGGRALERWRLMIAQSQLDHRIKLLGFTDRIADLLAAADLLVSPVRYEAYGLSVHEAICCGVPAMVPRTAGVAELYTAELQPLLIEDPEDVEALVASLLRWRQARIYWREKVESFSLRLRNYTLNDMAQRIVNLCSENSRNEVDVARAI